MAQTWSHASSIIPAIRGQPKLKREIIINACGVYGV